MKKNKYSLFLILFTLIILLNFLNINLTYSQDNQIQPQQIQNFINDTWWEGGSDSNIYAKAEGHLCVYNDYDNYQRIERRIDVIYDFNTNSFKISNILNEVYNELGGGDWGKFLNKLIFEPVVESLALQSRYVDDQYFRVQCTEAHYASFGFEIKKKMLAGDHVVIMLNYIFDKNIRDIIEKKNNYSIGFYSQSFNWEKKITTDYNLYKNNTVGYDYLPNYEAKIKEYLKELKNNMPKFYNLTSYLVQLINYLDPNVDSDNNKLAIYKYLKIIKDETMMDDRIINNFSSSVVQENLKILYNTLEKLRKFTNEKEVIKLFKSSAYKVNPEAPITHEYYRDLFVVSFDNIDNFIDTIKQYEDILYCIREFLRYYTIVDNYFITTTPIGTSGVDSRCIPPGNHISFLNQKLDELEKMFNKFSYASLEVATQTISLAVIPPVVWSDEHRGVESLAQITPQRIFDEVKNFLFSLAPIMFIFLLIVGGIFYLLSPIKIEYIKTGSEYIKWAVIGYFLLLVVSAIFSALKFIFGSP